MKKLIIFIIIFLIAFLLIKQFNNSIDKIKDRNANSVVTFSNQEIMDKAVFTSQQVPNDIYQNMLGKSIPLECKNLVDIKSLSYLQVTYFGFDEKFHVGEIIVNSNLSDDVLDIFKELYEIRYPIEKINLIDEYYANDELSMTDNNTSCFCYRPISGTHKISNHSNRYSNRY